MNKRTPRMLAVAAGAFCSVMLATPMRSAHAQEPIKIAVIAPVGITPGQALVDGAKLAENDINHAGGVNGRMIELKVYDSKLSTAAGVRALQKAVEQDHVTAVTGVFLSEVALALAPYAQRLHTPLIVESGTTQIGEMVHKHYDRYRNVFQLQLNAHFIAQEVCDAAHSLLLKGDRKHGSAVIMSEEAAWTKPLNKAYQNCLPKAGFKVAKEIDYAADTTDFGPVYNKVRAANPTVIVTGMAHTGLRPVLQWHQDQVPALMMGFNIQAGSGDFWQRSNGAAQGLVVVTNGAGGAPITPLAPGFYKAYMDQYHESPMLSAYTSYDAVLALAEAIRKGGGSTKTADVVKQLEKTDLDGVTGHIKFYGRNAKYTHALMYGKGLVTGVAFQWQNGHQTVVWPNSVAQGKFSMPGFVTSGN